MKTLVKIVLWAIGLVVLLVVALVLSLPLWLGPVVKPAASTVVPNFTKTSFSIDHLSLNPYTGRFELGGLKLGNPVGYSQPIAASIDTLVVDVAMETLGDEYIHVSEVTVKGLYASYVRGGENGVDNFTQIQYNLAGGKEKYEAAKAKKAAQAKTAEPKKEPKVAQSEGEKKFVIDRLTIGDVRVSLGPVTMPIPVAITLTDVGKKEKGVTMAELADQVWQAILTQAMKASDGAKLLGTMLGEQAGKLGEQAGKLGEQAGKLGEHAGKVTDAVKSVDVEGATKSVQEGAKKTVDALKGLFN